MWLDRREQGVPWPTQRRGLRCSSSSLPMCLLINGHGLVCSTSTSRSPSAQRLSIVVVALIARQSAAHLKRDVRGSSPGSPHPHPDPAAPHPRPQRTPGRSQALAGIFGYRFRSVAGGQGGTESSQHSARAETPQNTRSGTPKAAHSPPRQPSRPTRDPAHPHPRCPCLARHLTCPSIIAEAFTRRKHLCFTLPSFFLCASSHRRSDGMPYYVAMLILRLRTEVRVRADGPPPQSG